MKTYFQIFTTITALLLISCIDSGEDTPLKKLNAQEFSEKMKTLPTAPIIDVRTPQEFNNGHLPNAVNMDWNGNDFANQIAQLDKNSPVLIYCHSGSRSSSAVNRMIKEGFTEIYELSGGITAWNRR